MGGINAAVEVGKHELKVSLGSDNFAIPRSVKKSCRRYAFGRRTPKSTPRTRVDLPDLQ
jgi:hypothetical protein